MAYDEALAGRIRGMVAKRSGVTEKRMFGGVAFLLDGRMFCGVLKRDLVARVGPGANDKALAKPHTRPMDFTGRPMAGYVYVSPAGTSGPRSLKAWIEWSAGFARTLPARKKSR